MLVMIVALIKYPEEWGVGKQDLLCALIDDVSRGHFCKLYKKILTAYFDSVIIVLRKLFFFLRKLLGKSLCVCVCVVNINKLSCNYIGWGAYKHQHFISHSAGSWRAQDQGTDRFGVWWELALCFVDGCLLALSLHSRRGRELSGVPLINVLIPLIRVD